MYNITKTIVSSFSLLLLGIFISFNANAQEIPKVTVSGRIIEKISKQPLEYATVAFEDATSKKVVAGVMTDSKGTFSVNIPAGIYNVKFEFISFKENVMLNKELLQTTDLGDVALTEDAAQLNEVVVRAEKTSVEIKLDKKVYNVGQDMMVKGGTVSDVLENVPSVTVDVEGNVSLRGNENVRIFIDGRPSNSLNIADVLKQLPADAIDKVEVITNPSSRYDAEGGAGILNIILKKGKSNGFNGSVTASVGVPETYGLNGNLNYKVNALNFFTTTGYDYRTSQGAGVNENEYFNDNGTTRNFIFEDRDTERLRKGISTKTGVEWKMNATSFWTNSISYRENSGNNLEYVSFLNLDANKNFVSDTYRSSDGFNSGKNINFSSNYVKKFKKEGHKLTADYSYSSDSDNENALITAAAKGSNNKKFDTSFNNQRNYQTQFQMDYVLPLKEGSQLELGYKGNFNNLRSKYNVSTDQNGNAVEAGLSNTLQYKEDVVALYTQYGFKVNKLSYLFGLRYEATDIDINLLDTNDYNTKKYDNFFPSAFLNYEVSDKANVSTSYSKRLSRPRGRFLNPATNFSSNINLFQGNPDLNPSFTDKIDIGYLKRWDKVTFSTSIYFEDTKSVFSFVRSNTGDTTADGTAIILSKPINLGKEQTVGFEATANFSPLKSWKLNLSTNVLNAKTTGSYSFVNANNVLENINLNNSTLTWFARFGSRISFSKSSAWQLNGMYMGPRTTGQGKNFGRFVLNTAFSKDVLKDKATIAFNISDIFNSQINQSESNLTSVFSYNEFQWRKRQFNLSFTYRFNKKKNEREKNPQRNNYEEDGGGAFPG